MSRVTNVDARGYTQEKERKGMFEKGEKGSEQNRLDLGDTKVETILVSWRQLQRIKERCLDVLIVQMLSLI